MAFFHHFQQTGLGFRRCPVDLVSKDNLAENRTFFKLKFVGFWLNTDTPVISDGRRSGVNCILLKEQFKDLARDFTSVVFPTPGISSIST